MKILETDTLIITKGGKLVNNYWNGDLMKYVQVDVTDKAICKINNHCILDDDVTLEDVFLLLNTEIDVFDAMIGNWCKDYVEEGLKHVINMTKDKASIYNPDEIEYLELNWDFYYDDNTKYGQSFYGHDKPSFGGVGFKLKEDKLCEWKDKDGTDIIEWNKGSRIPWSLMGTPVYELKHLPVKLKDEIKVYNDNTESKDFHKIINTYKGASFTLHNILYGIIWELSFHGSPTKTIKFREEINKSVKEIFDNEK